MSPEEAAAFTLGVLFIASTAAVLIFRGPIGKAIARRLEGKAAPDSALVQQLEELELRLADVEPDRARVGDLEERLDFAERLLASGPERVKEGRE
jgi:hypothetical protein